MSNKKIPIISTGIDLTKAQNTAAAHADLSGKSEMELMLSGYGLMTAEILYRLPDHQRILQTFLWQAYDLAPKFPILKGFLEFWDKEIEGPLHSVQFTHRKLIAPSEWRKVDGIIELTRGLH